jgi:hypothetical protein
MRTSQLLVTISIDDCLLQCRIKNAARAMGDARGINEKIYQTIRSSSLPTWRLDSMSA